MDEFDLTYELQKMAAESPDEVEVSIDEEGNIEFEMNVKTFIESIKEEHGRRKVCLHKCYCYYYHFSDGSYIKSVIRSNTNVYICKNLKNIKEKGCN